MGGAAETGLPLLLCSSLVQGFSQARYLRNRPGGGFQTCWEKQVVVLSRRCVWITAYEMRDMERILEVGRQLGADFRICDHGEGQCEADGDVRERLERWDR